MRGPGLCAFDRVMKETGQKVTAPWSRYPRRSPSRGNAPAVLCDMHNTRRAATPTRPTGAGTPPLKPVNQLILLLLAESPTYGVDLLERIDEHLQRAVRLNAGSLYRLIGQLLEEGLVEAVEADTPSHQQGAPRKCYGVTSTGRAALAAEAQRQAQLLEMARSLDLIEEG